MKSKSSLLALTSAIVILVSHDVLAQAPDTAQLGTVVVSASKVPRAANTLSQAVTILSGDDSATLPLMAMGAKGVIAVITNLMPREMRDLTSAATNGDFARARELFAAAVW